MRNNIYKNEEELNKALDRISDAYSKPPTGSEYLFVVIWLVVLPFVGIIGYVYDVSWLFYIIGGLITLTEVFFLFTGALRCLGSVMLIVSCIIGYSITKSFWIGLMLGSCISASVLSIIIIAIMCFSGLAAITNLFKKKQEDEL